MSVQNTIHRHNLILERLRKGPATVPEIIDYIQARFEDEQEFVAVSNRTFHRDKADILKLYGIEIKYHRNEKNFYLDENDYPYHSTRILEAFNIAFMLNRTEADSGHVLFEERHLQGTEHFGILLQAIRNKLLLQYQYQNYADPVITHRTVQPYALKEAEGRWYLLATDTKDNKVKTFGLDRMSALKITRQHFKIPKGFNPEEQFRDCYGITGPNADAPSNIVLSFEPIAGRYIKSFPLHHSQRILADNDQELRISLRLYLTREFIMKILSYGASVRILQPSELQTLIKQELLKSLKQMEDLTQEKQVAGTS